MRVFMCIFLFPKLKALADLYFRALHSRFTCICILFSSSCFSVEKLPEDAKLAKRRNKYKSTVIFITNCLDNAELLQKRYGCLVLG